MSHPWSRAIFSSPALIKNEETETPALDAALTNTAFVLGRGYVITCSAAPRFSGVPPSRGGGPGARLIAMLFC